MCGSLPKWAPVTRLNNQGWVTSANKEKWAEKLRRLRDKRIRRRPMRILKALRAQLRTEGFNSLATRVGTLEVDLEDQIKSRETT